VGAGEIGHGWTRKNTDRTESGKRCAQPVCIYVLQEKGRTVGTSEMSRRTGEQGGEE